jgi:hypothetical protein
MSNIMPDSEMDSRPLPGPKRFGRKECC